MKREILVTTSLLLLYSTMSIAWEDREKKRTKTLDRRQHDTHLLIVLDVSGSMAPILPGIKSFLGAELPRLGANHAVGFMHFNGCGPSTIHYPVPIAKGTVPRILSVLRGLYADGATALAEALSLARQVIEGDGICPKMILLTDREDSCNGNPSAVLAGIDQYCLQISIVSTKSEEELIELKKLAESTGGKFHTAKDMEQRKAAFRKILAKKNQQKSVTTYDAKQKQKAKAGGGGEDSDEQGSGVREPKKARAGAGGSGEEETKNRE